MSARPRRSAEEVLDALDELNEWRMQDGVGAASHFNDELKSLMDGPLHGAIADVRATIAAQQQEIALNAPWFSFGCEVWLWLADHWESEDGWDLAEIAVECGLAERVKYDPAKHGECECETGDEITYPLKGDPEHINESRASLVNATLERAATACEERAQGPDSYRERDCAAAVRALKTTEER